MALRTKRADGIDITDPVEQVSMAGWFAFSVAILMASTVWAIYEEVAGLRPWKATQRQFKVAATAHYRSKLREAEANLAEVIASPEYRAAQSAVSEAEEGFEASVDQRKALQDKQAAKQEELAQVRVDLKSIRSEYQAAIYQWEQSGEAGKAKWIQEIKSREDTVLELIEKMTSLDDQVNKLAQEIFAFGVDVNEARAKEAEFRAEVARISGQLESVRKQDIDIIQFYVPELDHATDRCATCHIGAVTPGLEDISETLAGMPEFSYDVEKYASLFQTHPGDHLVKHPPDQFGCVSCHAGDGPSLTTEWEAHGTHHHHESPLFKSPSNAPKAFGHVAEAGCNKCHQSELDIPGAPLLSFGKQLFSETCSGCHKAKGISPEQDLLDNAQKALGRAEGALMQAKSRAAELQEQQDEINRLYDEEVIGDDEYDRRDKVIMAAKNEVRIDQVRAEEAIRVAKGEVEGAHKDIRWIGPDLRNVKEKLRPDWIKEWLLNPHAFSEKTKMPNFGLNDDEAEALAAYLWQTAREPQAGFDRSPIRDEDTIEEGEKLFTSSGCLACHVGGEENGEPIDIRPSFGMGEDGQPIKKRGFGPELLRTGEKARFDWLSRWIHDPYAMSPGTRMPNLRLRKEQADAIAAWLVTQQQEDTEPGAWNLADAPEYLEDDEKAEKGYALVQRYGCYSCHAISDMPPGEKKPAGWEPGDLMSERFGRIGVELSAHGSKTLHLFDFGLIEHKVQENMWGDTYHPNMTRFDYIAYKAWKPKDFEEGRYYTGPEDPAHLRMPNLNLSREEAHALATFVVSLVEHPVPAKYIYQPGYPGGAVTEGRNVTVKHNCIACHSMERDRGGYLRDRYEDLNNAPPTLVGEGRRIQPEWFFGFMKKPIHLRPWLEVRMPNFRLSDREAEILTAYFQGYDDQPYPYVSRPKPELTADEERQASEILVGQCARCHSLEEAYDPKGQAPMLDMAKERIKPEWVAPWVLNPQKFIPYTRMPNLGLSAEQAQLVSDYLQTLNEDPEPVGAYVPDEFHRAHEPALITEN